MNDVPKETPFLRTPYNYDTDYASEYTGLECKDESMAKQEFKEECDINTIIRRFALDGTLPENVRMPQNADFEEVIDFHTAMNVIRAAEEAFAAQPAKVRARFNNNPGLFVDFCSDPENRDEAIKLGMIEKPLTPPPAPVQSTAPAPSPAPTTETTK